MLLVVEGWWLKIHAALQESFTLRGSRDQLHAQVYACCGEGKIVGTNPSENFLIQTGLCLLCIARMLLSSSLSLPLSLSLELSLSASVLKTNWILLRIGDSCLSSSVWQTRKIKRLFNLKDKNRHKSSVIYGAEPVHMWRNLHRGSKKKLRSTKGRTREHVSQLQTSPSPRKTPNRRIHMEHWVNRENHLSEENDGEPANWLWETNTKQLK